MLQAHLNNCPRCVEHEAVLNEELESLYRRYLVPAPEEARDAVREALIGESATDAPTGAAAASPAAAQTQAPAPVPVPPAPVPPPQEIHRPTVVTGGKSPVGGKVAVVAEEKESTEASESKEPERADAPDEPREAEGRHPSELDAMGLDKRRGVMGQSYGPTFAKQATLYGGVLIVIILAFFGLSAAVGSLDKAPKANPDKAPWSKPKQEAPTLGVDCLGAPREACLETSKKH
jgi:hypothetical protein